MFFNIQIPRSTSIKLDPHSKNLYPFPNYRKHKSHMTELKACCMPSCVKATHEIHLHWSRENVYADVSVSNPKLLILNRETIVNALSYDISFRLSVPFHGLPTSSNHRLHTLFIIINVLYVISMLFKLFLNCDMFFVIC